MKSFPTYVLVMVLSTLLLFGCKSTETSLSKSDRSGTDSALSTHELRSFQFAFYDGLRAKILEDNEEAKKLFGKALEIDPTSGATLFEMAQIYAQDNQYGTATSYAERAYASDKSNPWYGQILAQLYGETGRWNDAIEVMQSMIERDPDDYENYYRLGSLLSAQGQNKAALALLDQVENRFGPSEDLSMQRQMIYIELKQYDLALAEANRLITAHPEEVRYMGIKAEILEKAGRSVEATALYHEMLEVDPENGLVLLALYEDSNKNGKPKEADGYLQRAFGSKDLNIDVKINILLNLMSTSRYAADPESLLALGSKIEAAHPDNPKSYAVQGDLYYGLNQLEESRKNFRRAVELDPNRPPIWQQILTIDSQLGDFDAMKSESDEAMALFPQQPVFYLFNGVSLLQMKKPGEAVDILSVGKNLVIDDNQLLAQFHSSLGDAYHALGDNANSDKSYEKALQYNPKNVVVLNNFAYYLSLRGDSLDKAEAMAKKANDLHPDEPGFQDTYAWVLFKRKNYQNALFWIRESLKNGGDGDPVILEHHGDILEAMGRFEDAVDAWQMALDHGGDAEGLFLKMVKYKNGGE